MIFGKERDLFEVARNFAHFFAHESCGFCTPCRVGTTLMRDALDKIAAGRGSRYEINELMRLYRIVAPDQPLRPRPDGRQRGARHLAEVPPGLRAALHPRRFRSRRSISTRRSTRARRDRRARGRGRAHRSRGMSASDSIDPHRRDARAFQAGADHLARRRSKRGSISRTSARTPNSRRTAAANCATSSSTAATPRPAP